MLEEEIYGANSPIWESGFTMPPSEGTQLVPRPGMLCGRPSHLSPTRKETGNAEGMTQCGTCGTQNPDFLIFLSQRQSVPQWFLAPPSSAPPWVEAAAAL